MQLLYPHTVRTYLGIIVPISRNETGKQGVSEEREGESDRDRIALPSGVALVLVPCEAAVN